MAESKVSVNPAFLKRAKKEADLDPALVRELIHYDPLTGVITWKHRARKWFNSDRAYAVWNARFPGMEAGTIWDYGRSGNRYRFISIQYQRHRAHRLAFAYMTGRWPKDSLDHVDGDGLNNCWANLREATLRQNGANRGKNKNNTSGFKCVHFDRSRGSYIATIQDRHIGRFPTIEDAVAAYEREAKKVWGDFARTE